MRLKVFTFASRFVQMSPLVLLCLLVSARVPVCPCLHVSPEYQCISKKPTCVCICQHVCPRVSMRVDVCHVYLCGSCVFMCPHVSPCICMHHMAPYASMCLPVCPCFSMRLDVAPRSFMCLRVSPYTKCLHVSPCVSLRVHVRPYMSMSACVTMCLPVTFM